MEADHGTVTRVALGASASLGDLYNARTDKFCGMSLLNKTISSTSFTSVDNPFSDISFVLTDSFSEKMAKLHLSAELKVSFLAGLVSIEGSGKYLKDEKKSARSVRNTLKYSITTKTERLNLFGDDMKGWLNTTLLEDDEATHVVAEITWGANLHVVVEYKNEEDEDIQAIEGSLSAHMNKFGVSVSGKAEVGITTGDKLKNANFSLTVYGDVVSSEPVPKTIEEAQDLVSRMPTLVGRSNEGKGKPVSLLLVPLAKLRSHFSINQQINTVIHSIEESSIYQVIRVFDEILSVKQKLNDLVEDLRKFGAVLPSKSYQKARELLCELEMEESELKAKLRRTLTSVRSGDRDSACIDDLLQKYQGNEFSAPNVSIQVETGFDKERGKIDLVRGLFSQGVKVLERGQTVNNLLFSKPNSKWYVFFYKSPTEPAHKEVLSQNRYLFLEILRQSNQKESDSQKSPPVDFLFVDLDVSSENEPADLAKDGSSIQLFENGKRLSANLLRDNTEKSSKCVASCCTPLSTSQYMPTKRTFLKVRCPGSINGPCKNDPVKWQCTKCEGFLEYDFESSIYCSCGRGSVWDYEYICQDTEHHGAAPLKYSDDKKTDLKFQLDSLRPFEEYTILLLGETGVGKSTWINGFANYLQYETLDEAEQNEMHCLIPSSFHLFGKTITMGNPDKNETQVTGQSATQYPTTYAFPYGESTVRIIDTPGVGDTRGLQQDKDNFVRIINHLSRYKEVHCICILLKPNEARVNVFFEFCIKELLAHLHKDAINNIVFCFTNARATMYQPGETYSSLQTILASSGTKNGPLITLSHHTVYCMDNEAVRFLAAVKSGVIFSSMQRDCFVGSWKKAVDESNRILDHLKTVPPHKIHDTVSLNQARQSVLTMSRPLADISRSIQYNIDVLNEKQKELRTSKDNEAELRNKLYVPVVSLEPIYLDYPRTVCTAPRCVESRHVSSPTGSGGPLSLTHYKQICHDHCYISGVTTNQMKCRELQECSCMGADLRCTVCGCSWEDHMHITYDTVEKTVKLKCKDIENHLSRTLSTSEQAQIVVDKCQRQKKELEDEQEIITRASAKFAHFLQANAISLYNDATLLYMDQLIQAEEGRVHVGGQRTTLDGLKNNKATYEKEIEILKKEANQYQGGSLITISDINDIKDQLFKLPINGKTFKDHFSTARNSGAIAHKEIYHAPKRSRGQNKRFGLPDLSKYMSKLF